MAGRKSKPATPDEEHEEHDEDSEVARFSCHSRAAAVEYPPLPDTVAERVQYVVDRMAAIDWPPGSDVTLGKAWGLTPAAIRRYSSEAQRVVVKAVKRDPEELRCTFLARLDEIARSALHAPKYKDHKAAVQAIALAVDILGLKQQPKGESSPIPEIVLTDELPTDLPAPTKEPSGD